VLSEERRFEMLERLLNCVTTVLDGWVSTSVISSEQVPQINLAQMRAVKTSPRLLDNWESSASQWATHHPQKLIVVDQAVFVAVERIE